MVNYQPNEVMLETLKKVQPFQVDIFNAGLHCHIDGGLYSSFATAPHIGFDVTVFEGDTIARQFEFSADMTERELLAEVESLAAYVDRIKNEDE